MNQENQNSTGACLACGCGIGAHRHSLLRIVLGLIIVGFVFTFGFKLGELQAEVGMSYQRHDMMMDRGGYQAYGQGNMMPMQPATTTVTPATTTTTAGPVTH